MLAAMRVGLTYALCLPTLGRTTNVTQDAHEFFNFVLNEMADSLVARKKRQEEEATVREHKKRLQQNGSHHHRQTNNSSSSGSSSGSSSQASSSQPPPPPQQQQQPQDTRRPSPWSKMSALKGSFGSSSQASLAAAGREGAAAGAVEGVGDTGTSSAAVKVDVGGTTESAAAGGGGGGGSSGTTAGEVRSSDGSMGETWIHRIFQGVLTNQTKCLCCETVRFFTFFRLGCSFFLGMLVGCVFDALRWFGPPVARPR